MKACIDATGCLAVQPENTTEAYALRAWYESACPAPGDTLHAGALVIQPYELTPMEAECLHRGEPHR